MKLLVTLRRTARRHLRLIGLVGVLVLLLGGYWLIPIPGQVVILTDPTQSTHGTWPQIWIDPPAARPNGPISVYVRDRTPWSYVKLTLDGADTPRDEGYATGMGPWTWRWNIQIPQPTGATVVFYHSCHRGCVERGRVVFGTDAEAPQREQPVRPTKLGMVFADADRNWRGRAGWTVELTYVDHQDDVDFSLDGLARRAAQAERRGLRVLVRISYQRQQALPPVGDEVALERFLTYCERLARDDRLNGVYGYIVGAVFNTVGENRLAPTQPTTPEWYARVFNGAGLDPLRTDNVVQTMRAVDPQVRILVGPVAPWNTDQSGATPDPSNQPWLNYMNTLVAQLDASVAAHLAHGIPMTGPDGFTLRAPGRVDAPEIARHPEQEPTTDLHRAEWGTAQAGFRVYRDWIAIINRYPSTRGLPAYITSANIITSDTQAPPAQTYPAGWLTAALAEVDREPQVQALCWFVDQPLGGIWDNYSLSVHPGKLHDAANEFDQLLQR